MTTKKKSSATPYNLIFPTPDTNVYPSTTNLKFENNALYWNGRNWTEKAQRKVYYVWTFTSNAVYALLNTDPVFLNFSKLTLTFSLATTCRFEILDNAKTLLDFTLPIGNFMVDIPLEPCLTFSTEIRIRTSVHAAWVAGEYVQFNLMGWAEDK